MHSWRESEQEAPAGGLSIARMGRQGSACPLAHAETRAPRARAKQLSLLRY